MTKQIVIAASCLLALAMVIITSSCASQPSEPSPPASSPGYPKHGITTTKVEPKPGESVARGSASWVRYTMDDLVEKSDTILIGKVVDIFPSRQVDKPPWIVITDVVIEVEHYLYGQPQSAHIPTQRITSRMCLSGRVPFGFLILRLARPQPTSSPEDM